MSAYINLDPPPGATGTSTAAGRTRTPSIFALGDHLLHDWVQILQPRRTAERLAAQIDVVGYRIVAEVDRIGEGVQSVGEIKLVPHHFTIVVRVGELSMRARVSPKVIGRTPLHQASAVLLHRRSRS
jgi:hypothetical protein